MRLQEMFAQNKSLTDMARELSRSEGACRQHCHALGLKSPDSVTEVRRRARVASARAQGHHVWTYSEQILLVELREDEGWEWDKIAAHMGIDVSACVAKYGNLRYRINSDRQRYQQAPNAAVIDRERRDAARDRQSITGSVFGDPPPGYSALDRKRAGQRA